MFRPTKRSLLSIKLVSLFKLLLKLKDFISFCSKLIFFLLCIFAGKCEDCACIRNYHMSRGYIEFSRVEVCINECVSALF